MENAISISLYVLWAVLIIIAVAIEMLTPTNYIGWAMAIASSAALITHGIKQDPGIDVVVFLSIWIPLWIIAIILFKFVFKNKSHNKDDGYMKYIGNKYRVIEETDKYGYGLVLVDGKKFRFNSKEQVKVDEKIIVKKIKGVTIYTY